MLPLFIITPYNYMRVEYHPGMLFKSIVFSIIAICMVPAAISLAQTLPEQQPEQQCKIAPDRTWSDSEQKHWIEEICVGKAVDLGRLIDDNGEYIRLLSALSDREKENHKLDAHFLNMLLSDNRFKVPNGVFIIGALFDGDLIFKGLS